MTTQQSVKEPPLSKIGAKVMPRFSVFQSPPKALATYQMLGFFGSISTSCMRPVVRVGPMLRNSRPFKRVGGETGRLLAPEEGRARRRGGHRH